MEVEEMTSSELANARTQGYLTAYAGIPVRILSVRPSFDFPGAQIATVQEVRDFDGVQRKPYTVLIFVD